MPVLSSSLFQNSVMILFLFKMQDMYSSNLSRIYNITSFFNAVLHCLGGTECTAAFNQSSLSLLRVNPTP